MGALVSKCFAIVFAYNFLTLHLPSMSVSVFNQNPIASQLYAYYVSVFIVHALLISVFWFFADWVGNRIDRCVSTTDTFSISEKTFIDTVIIAVGFLILSKAVSPSVMFFTSVIQNSILKLDNMNAYTVKDWAYLSEATLYIALSAFLILSSSGIMRCVNAMRTKDFSKEI